MTDAGFHDAEGTEERSPVLHDVGTQLVTSGGRIGAPLSGLRTPSLHGLFATAPYLHDGRAATLGDALAAHGIGASAADEADLVAYLREIEGLP